jgi:aminopeptidase
MGDPRMNKLAQILVQYSTSVQPGDWVIINANTAAMPLAQATYREALRAGGRVTVQLEDESLQEINLREASEDQLRWISPFEHMAVHEADVRINILGAHNTRSLSGTDPARARLVQTARRALFETYLERAAQGRLRWVLTQFPCQAYAQEADMSLAEYEDFVYGATFADRDDPVAEWQRVHDEQQRLVDWLKGKQNVVVRGPNSDLRLSIAGRFFKNSDGKNNLPSGEIFTGPVEESVEGWIRFTYPAVFRGRVVDGVELRFEAGRVVEAKAAQNEEFLLTMLDSDEGARYLGEFAIGTNFGIQRFTKSILFDEKIGGSIHVAVGNGYPETGSKNRSAIHWDFICDMRDNSEIWVDEELFYKNGKFVVG